MIDNEAALAKRKEMPVRNELSAKDLLGMPPYFGWVDCVADTAPFHMLLGGSDDGVALRFFWNDGYESTTLKTWSRLAKKAELALDVGAHTGVYTLAAKAANRNILVASFEPYFMNFARLNINLRANGCETGNSFMLAIADTNKVLPFTVHSGPDYLTSGGSLGAHERGTIIHVQTMPLDSLIPDTRKSKVGLVKIDTEGAEALCLKGMSAILDASQPIIFFECISEESGRAVETLLSTRGYSFLEIDDNRNTITPTPAILPSRDETGKLIYGRLNRIALPPGTSSISIINS